MHFRSRLVCWTCTEMAIRSNCRKVRFSLLLSIVMQTHYKLVLLLLLLFLLLPLLLFLSLLLAAAAVVSITITSTVAAVVSITITVVIVCVGRTYYLTTDSGSIKFVIHKRRDLHCHIMCNCLLTNTVSYTVCMIFILCFNTKCHTSNFNGLFLICVKLKAELKFWMTTIHIKL